MISSKLQQELNVAHACDMRRLCDARKVQAEFTFCEAA